MMQKTKHLEASNKGLTVLLEAVSLQLRGKPLWRIRRSTGSVLLLDLGAKRQHANKGKMPLRGEWRFLIQMASWKILRQKEILLTSNDAPELIDKDISKALLGKQVALSAFSNTGSFTITFDDDTKLYVRKNFDRNYNQNWSLFFEDLWVITNADKQDKYEFTILNR